MSCRHIVTWLNETSVSIKWLERMMRGLKSDRSPWFLWLRLSRGCEKLWLGTSPEWQLPPVWNIQDYPVLKLMSSGPISTESPIHLCSTSSCSKKPFWFENNLAHFPDTSIVLDIGSIMRASAQDYGKHIDILFDPNLDDVFKVSIFCWDLMAGVWWCCVLALGVMPAWCGPEQILFIFNQISARIRTEREPGHERGGGGICEVTRGPGVTGRGRQEQSGDSFHHTRQSLVSLRHFPTKLVRRAEHAGSQGPAAAKMRTKKAGPGSRAATPASTDQWEPSAGRLVTNESTACVTVVQTWRRELSWWRRRAAPGTADSRTVQRHLGSIEDTEGQHQAGGYTYLA